MSAAYPQKWFVKPYFGRITLRKVDRLAESMRSVSPYFDTWDEAHAYLINWAQTRLKKAKAEVPQAERALKRIQAMQPATKDTP